MSNGSEHDIMNARALLGGSSWFANFMGPAQRFFLLESILRGEEAAELAKLVVDAATAIRNTPLTYQTTDLSMGEKKLCLHYFRGGIDAWIVERDIGDCPLFNPIETPVSEWPIPPEMLGFDVQHQAFGRITVVGGGWREAEWGYISIQELIDNGVELDLHWVVKTAKEMK